MNSLATGHIFCAAGVANPLFVVSLNNCLLLFTSPQVTPVMITTPGMPVYSLILALMMTVPRLLHLL
jgi:hypothetical protein